MAAALGTGVIFLGLTFSLGYIYGAPLLYEGFTVPVALNTALCFVILGFIVTLSAAQQHLLDKKAAEDELLRARALSSIIECAPDPIVITDIYGHIALFNRAFAIKTGFGDQVLNRDLGDLFLESRRDEISVRLSKVAEDSDLNNAEATLVCTDNRTVPVLINAAVLQDQEASSTRMVHVMRDISDLKLAERINRHLASFPENSPIPIIELDSAGNINYINNTAISMFPEICTSGTNHPFLNDVLPMVAAMTEAPPAKDLVWKDIEVGNRWFARAIFIFSDEERTYLRIYGIEITERKMLEAVKNEFIMSVSHELRTPLSIAKEGTALIIDELAGPTTKQQKKILGTITNHIDRLEKIIGDILDISVIESGKISLSFYEVNINELLRTSARTFDERANEKGLKISLGDTHKEIICKVDVERMLQVFASLIENSIKFTDHGNIDIHLAKDNGYARITITDTGSGIAQEDLQRIFRKFQQFKRTPGAGTKGTGLGLAISKGLVELHNGTIDIHSETGKGTTVIIRLPLAS